MRESSLNILKLLPRCDIRRCYTKSSPTLSSGRVFVIIKYLLSCRFMKVVYTMSFVICSWLFLLCYWSLGMFIFSNSATPNNTLCLGGFSEWTCLKKWSVFWSLWHQYRRSQNLSQWSYPLSNSYKLSN